MSASVKLLAALFVFGFAAAGTSFAQDSVPNAVAEHSPAVAASSPHASVSNGFPPREAVASL